MREVGRRVGKGRKRGGRKEEGNGGKAGDRRRDGRKKSRKEV